MKGQRGGAMGVETGVGGVGARGGVGGGVFGNSARANAAG